MPSYTVQQCEEEIAAIDAELKKLRTLAGDFMVGNKRFVYSGTRRELRAEREEWVTRLAIARGQNPFQGPRLTET